MSLGSPTLAAFRVTATGLAPCEPSPAPVVKPREPRTQAEAVALLSHKLASPSRTTDDDVHDDCLALLAGPGTHEQRTSNVMARMRATYGGTA